MGGMGSFIHQVRCFTLLGLFRYLYLQMTGKSILVTGSCCGCGMCCRNIALEGGYGWLRSEKEFQKIVQNYPEYERFVPNGRDPQGVLLFSCSWQTPQNICRDYDDRLALCRRFPESTLFFADGQLPPTCGYKFSIVVPFKKLLKTAIKGKK